MWASLSGGFGRFMSTKHAINNSDYDNYDNYDNYADCDSCDSCATVGQNNCRSQ